MPQVGSSSSSWPKSTALLLPCIVTIAVHAGVAVSPPASSCQNVDRLPFPALSPCRKANDIPSAAFAVKGYPSLYYVTAKGEGEPEVRPPGAT